MSSETDRSAAKYLSTLRSAWLSYRHYFVATAAIGAAVYASSSDYGTLLLAHVLIYALAVSGWNIVSGYAGQPSLGHAAFFGLGAYGAAIWSIQLQSSPWIGIALGAAAAGAVAILVGWVSWRLKIRGIYFALILFAVSELLMIIASNIDFVGGTTGLYGFVREDSFIRLSFRSPLWFAGIAAVGLVITLAGTHLLSLSRLGRQISVVKHDEVAAEASGIDAMRVKLIALGISAVVTAVAGGLYAQLQLFIQPDTVFGMATNLRFILIGFLGGVGVLWGPFIGSVLVTSIETLALEVFRGLPGIDGIAFGLMLVVAVLFLPNGLAWRRSTAKKTAINSEARSDYKAEMDLRSKGMVAERTLAETKASRTLVLESKGLTKSFGGLAVVDDVSIKLMSGTIHGLIGPNGAGKTTMINMLTGTIQSDSGEVLLKDHSLEGYPSFRFARAGIARTFQIPRPLGDLTVEESVYVASVASGRPKNPQAATLRALQTTGMAEHGARMWDSLNGSEKRRVEVARALAQEPMVLLLDEPMSGLGPEEIDALVDTIKSLPSRHPDMTILFVEHLMRVMMTLADHITVLDRGKVIGDGTPNEVAGNPLVKEAYLGSSVA
jgi:branched-chain amino acid transport system permease protein|tara:strand:- start:759 stop:2582 length:1824 start_codon:yes stop_codon:yes gene_type:complete